LYVKAAQTKLSFGSKYSMCHLICDIISHCASSFLVGKIKYIHCNLVIS